MRHSASMSKYVTYIKDKKHVKSYLCSVRLVFAKIKNSVGTFHIGMHCPVAFGDYNKVTSGFCAMEKI